MTMPMVDNAVHSGVPSPAAAAASGRERSRPVPSPTLEALLKVYKPKKRYHKDADLIKTILSLWQGHDGGIARCELCFPGDRCKDQQNHLNPISTDNLEIHHGDENPSNNDIKNLFVAHHPCNSSDFQRTHFHKGSSLASYPTPAYVRDQNGPAQASINESNSENDNASPELQKHDRMTPKFWLWINDLKKGPFASGKEWKRKDLAASAAFLLGEGSPVTYNRSIDVAIQGGIIGERKINGNRLRLYYLGRPLPRYAPDGIQQEPAPAESAEYAIQKLTELDNTIPTCKICGEQFKPLADGSTRIWCKTCAAKPVCMNCCKPFDPNIPGASGMTCSDCISKGESN